MRSSANCASSSRPTSSRRRVPNGGTDGGKRTHEDVLALAGKHVSHRHDHEGPVTPFEPWMFGRATHPRAERRGIGSDTGQDRRPPCYAGDAFLYLLDHRGSNAGDSVRPPIEHARSRRFLRDSVAGKSACECVRRPQFSPAAARANSPTPRHATALRRARTQLPVGRAAANEKNEAPRTRSCGAKLRPRSWNITSAGSRSRPAGVLCAHTMTTATRRAAS